MANSGTLFRSQIGGFNRDDVNNYIKETDIKYSTQIEGLKADLAKASATISNLKAEKEALLREKEEASGILEEAKRKAEESENSAKEIGILLSGKDIELGQAKDRIAELEEKVAELENNVSNPPVQEGPSLEELTAKIAELTDLANEKDGIIVSLNDEIERLNASKQTEEAPETASEIQPEAQDGEEPAGETYAEEAPACDACCGEAPAEETPAEEAPAEETPAEEASAEEAPAEEAATREMPAEEEKAEDHEDHDSKEYKQMMYDKISSQIGDILIKANRNADEIVSAAKDEAKRITDEIAEESAKNREKAKSEAEALVNRMHEITSDAADTLKSGIHADAENCINELNMFVDNMKFELQALISKISGGRDEMNEKLSFFRRNSAEEIEKKLNETDALFNSLTNRENSNEE
ncbi:MAG: hypothetical protein IJU57_00275 [Clostridia bacterium]|nr:hypothetical protein [Clostridia bacterium]